MANSHPSRITQEALIGSIERLITKKSFNDISVSELTKVAGISRMTFYRNYRNIIQVLSYQVDLLLAEFTTTITYNGDDYQYIKQVIEFFQAHRDFIKVLLSANQQNLLLQEVATILKKLATHNQYLTAFTEKETYYFVEYHTTGLMSVIIDWIQNGEPEPVDELAKFLTANSRRP